MLWKQCDLTMTGKHYIVCKMLITDYCCHSNNYVNNSKQGISDCILLRATAGASLSISLCCLYSKNINPPHTHTVQVWCIIRVDMLGGCVTRHFHHNNLQVIIHQYSLLHTCVCVCVPSHLTSAFWRFSGKEGSGCVSCCSMMMSYFSISLPGTFGAPIILLPGTSNSHNALHVITPDCPSTWVICIAVCRQRKNGDEMTTLTSI